MRPATVFTLDSLGRKKGLCEFCSKRVGNKSFGGSKDGQRR